MEGNTLVGWDCEEEDKRILFMEHLYKCDNRHFPDHPKHDAWKAWRTALRDWPTTSEFPDTKPTKGY